MVAAALALSMLGGCANWNWGTTGKSWLESVCRQEKKPCVSRD
jgi:hypothetical protein